MTELQIYAFGSNGSGQLGVGHTLDLSTPHLAQFWTPIHKDSRVLKIVGGGNHTLILFNNPPYVYWAGDLTTKSCGTIHPAWETPAALSKIFYPMQFPATRADLQPHYIAATWEASIIVRGSLPGVSSAGISVETCGTGNKGELGLGNSVRCAEGLTRIPDFPPEGTGIVDISASMCHVVTVLTNGEAWGWGAGRKGQLGSQGESIIYSPRKIPGIPFKVSRAVCGTEFSAFFGSPESGDCVVLGSDKWGIQSKMPSRETIAGWKDVAGGWGHIYVLKRDGRILSWGRTDHGQGAPADLPHVKSIAAGSEHVLALDDNKEVSAWGWGEHGNCGPAFEEGQHKYNKIFSGLIGRLRFPNHTITTIGTGCATSWVVLERDTTIKREQSPLYDVPPGWHQTAL